MGSRARRQSRGGEGRLGFRRGNVSVLNAFAYTCGVGVAAAAGGAKRVLNTDHSATYLEVGFANAELNGFERFRRGV